MPLNITQSNVCFSKQRVENAFPLLVTSVKIDVRCRCTIVNYE